MDRQEAAYTLYEQGWDQKQIAAIFKVSEQTISSWATKGKWKGRRVVNGTAQATAEDSLRELIAYQLKALKLLTAKWLSEAPDKPRLIDKGEIDALTKMFSAVRGKELAWSGYVRVAREILECLRAESPALAKKAAPVIDLFLGEKRKEA